MASLRDGDGSAKSGMELTVAVLALSFTLAILFQTVQLVRESYDLNAAQAQQDPALQETARLRQETDSLATETAALAGKGDAGAKEVVNDLARDHVALHVPNAGLP